MKKLLSIYLSLCLALSGCVGVNSGSLKALINAGVLISVNHYSKKHPEEVVKIKALADILDVVAKVSTNALTKDEFLTLVNKVDTNPDWKILGSALFDIYTENVKLPENTGKYSEVLKSLASSLRDAVTVVEKV